MRELEIAGTVYGDDNPLFIAEASHNHGGDLDKAKAQAVTAKESGASIIKFQVRHPKEVYAPTEARGGYYYKGGNPQWMDESYGAHREKLEFSYEAWVELFRFCRSIDLPAFATPFDTKSADLLESLDVPAYKIASGDATNIPLIEHVAAKGKPVLVSTGGCSMQDVDRIWDSFDAAWEADLALFQCACIYPAPDEVMNLRVIETYRERYPDTLIGLSTHNPSWIPTVAAFTLGARMFEHHFTNDRNWKGTDNAFSLTPPDFKAMVEACGKVQAALGSSEKSMDEQETEYTIERQKSLYWARDCEIGHVVTAEDIKILSPGGGLPPYAMKEVIGQRVEKPAEKGTVIWAGQYALGLALV
jgi:sialic acid synthase